MAHPIYSVDNRFAYASYLGTKMWGLISTEIKAIESIAAFKQKIKK